MGCFRGSHFTKDQCKQLRNATDPLLLVKCDGYCKCFFCHHFSRAWVFDAFYSATLKFEQHGGLTHAKEYDNVKGNAIHSALRNRPPEHLGSSFVSLAKDAIVLEESTHHGKITNKTLACLGDGCEAGLADHFLPSLKFNIAPFTACPVPKRPC